MRCLCRPPLMSPCVQNDRTFISLKRHCPHLRRRREVPLLQASLCFLYDLSQVPEYATFSQRRNVCRAAYQYWSRSGFFPLSLVRYSRAVSFPLVCRHDGAASYSTFRHLYAHVEVLFVHDELWKRVFPGVIIKPNLISTA